MRLPMTFERMDIPFICLDSRLHLFILFPNPGSKGSKVANRMQPLERGAIAYSLMEKKKK